MVEDYHGMASLKLDNLQSFKHKADMWFDEGKNDKILEFVDSNL